MRDIARHLLGAEETTFEFDYDNRSIGDGLSLFMECVEDDTGKVRWRRPVTISYVDDATETCATPDVTP